MTAATPMINPSMVNLERRDHDVGAVPQTGRALRHGGQQCQRRGRVAYQS
jgi:hypothetical protein